VGHLVREDDEAGARQDADDVAVASGVDDHVRSPAPRHDAPVARLRSSQESEGPRPRRASARSASRFTAAGESGGTRPSGGSTFDVGVDLAFQNSYQCVGPAPVSPPMVLAARSCGPVPPTPRPALRLRTPPFARARPAARTAYSRRRCTTTCPVDPDRPGPVRAGA
jgi:hypothetical protein